MCSHSKKSLVEMAQDYNYNRHFTKNALLKDYQKILFKLHDVFSAEVKDKHHVQMNQVNAKRQPTQRCQKRPRKKFIDDP